MLIELLNRVLLFFSPLFEEFEELNSDYYPENYVEIDGELIQYEN